jgi:hypothetical protein
LRRAGYEYDFVFEIHLSSLAYMMNHAQTDAVFSTLQSLQSRRD